MPEKLPANKVAYVVDPKIGVATLITKTESSGSADAQSRETAVKQLVYSTSDRNIDVIRPASMQETQPKQIDSSSFPNSSAGDHDAACLISLHEDQSLPPQRQRQTQSQRADFKQHVGLDSTMTCSDNLVRLQSDSFCQMEDDTASSSSFSPFTSSMFLSSTFLCSRTIIV